MSSAKAVDLAESKQAGLRALYIAMAIVPTVIVLVRAWSRALLPVPPTSIISTKFWWDDWTAFAAAVRGSLSACSSLLALERWLKPGLDLTDWFPGDKRRSMRPRNQAD